MKEIKRKVLIWESIGVLFIILFGSLLHFTYKWSGYSPIVGMFSAVNESVWEHLKLGFWSLCLFALIEYYFIKNKVNNFIVAKAIGILSLQLIVIFTYYTYTYFIGKDILIIDISSYIVGAIICQFISYKILFIKVVKNKYMFLSIIFIILHGLSLIIFTFLTPKLPIFLDKHSNRYGTEWNINHNDYNEHNH